MACVPGEGIKILMATADADSRLPAWELVDGVRWLSAGSAVVVFQPDSGEFIELRGTASDLWSVSVEACWDSAAAVEYVCASSSADHSEAMEIVDAYLADLAAHAVIRRV